VLYLAWNSLFHSSALFPVPALLSKPQSVKYCNNILTVVNSGK
jgi:hypothetical protein